MISASLLDRVRAVFEEEANELRAAVAAGPAERRPEQDVIAVVESGAFVEKRGGEGEALFGRDMSARAGDAVENGEAEVRGDVGVAAFEDQAEADGIRRAVRMDGFDAVAPDAQGLFKDGEPAGIFARPVDQIKGQTDNFGVATPGRAPEQLLGECVAADAVEIVRSFASQHPTREFGETEEAGRGGFGFAAVARQKLDHLLVALAEGQEHRRAARGDSGVGVDAAIEEQLSLFVLARSGAAPESLRRVFRLVVCSVGGGRSRSASSIMATISS